MGKFFQYDLLTRIKTVTMGGGSTATKTKYTIFVKIRLLSAKWLQGMTFFANANFSFQWPKPFNFHPTVSLDEEMKTIYNKMPYRPFSLTG